MATDVSSFFFEKHLNANSFGLTYQVALAWESFLAKSNNRDKILLAPVIGGDAAIDTGLQDALSGYLGSRLLTFRDTADVVSRYGVGLGFSRLMAVSYQRALAIQILKSNERSRTGRKWARQAYGIQPMVLPMTALEVMGSVNQLKSQKEDASQLIQAARSRNPVSLWNTGKAYERMVQMSQRLATFAAHRLGVKYVLVSYINHPHYQTNMESAGRYPEKVRMSIGIIDIETGKFELYAESHTRTQQSHAPPHFLLAGTIRHMFGDDLS